MELAAPLLEAYEHATEPESRLRLAKVIQRHFISLRFVIHVSWSFSEKILSLHCEPSADFINKISQALVNVIGRRPALDLGRAHPGEGYSSAVVAVQIEGNLLRDIITAQVKSENMLLACWE